MSEFTEKGLKVTNLTVDAISANLNELGIKSLGTVLANQQASELYELSLARSESRLTNMGALCVETGSHTGRSAQDKFVVEDDVTADTVWWDNNKSMSPEHFATLKADMMAHAEGRELFVQDLHGGADPVSKIKVRVVMMKAWQLFSSGTCLFAQRQPNLRVLARNSQL